MMFKTYAPPVYEVRSPPRNYYPPSAYYPQKYTPVQVREAYSPHTRHASYDSYVSPLPEYILRPEYASPLHVYEPREPVAFAQQERARPKTSPKSQKTRTSVKKEKITVAVDDIDPVFYDGVYSPEGTPPPPYGDSRHTYHGVHPDETRTSPPAYKTRARAMSSPEKPARQPSTKHKSKPASKPKQPPKATAKDAARAGIPQGYSLKNWDPTEEPILLLGSVFDANTLGKWIYDWTVFHHGAGAPMADHAGELWLSMIELASKMRRADECFNRIKRRSKRETIEDFLDEGDRLLKRLKKILRRCEDDMWAAARAENGGRKPSSLGANSGCAFVDSIFGRDRELQSTEKLMADMRYWTHRFNGVGEDILRHPRD